MSSSPDPAASDPYLSPRSHLEPEEGPACRAFSSAAVTSMIASRRSMLIGGAGIILAIVVETAGNFFRMVIISQANGESHAALLTVIFVLCAMLVAAMVMPWWSLKRSLDAIRRLQTSRHDLDLEAALREHGHYWKRLGAGMLVAVVISLVFPLAILPFLDR